MLAEEMGCLFLKMNSLYPVTSSPSFFFFFLVSFQKIDFLGLKKKKSGLSLQAMASVLDVSYKERLSLLRLFPLKNF